MGSVRLKFTGPVPVFFGPPFGAALLLPKHVGTPAKVLVMSAMPVFLGPLFGAALLLPKKVSLFANNLLQALLCLIQDVPIIPIGFQSSTPTDMHSRSQSLEIGVGDQLRVGSRLQCFLFVFSFLYGNIWSFDCDIGKMCITADLLLFNTSTKRSVIGPSFCDNFLHTADFLGETF
jgi:hypothetical protein